MAGVLDGGDSPGRLRELGQELAGRRPAAGVRGPLLVGYAASIGVTRLEAHVAPDNHASRRVAESAGFTQAGTVTGDDGTEMIRYARG